MPDGGGGIGSRPGPRRRHEEERQSEDGLSSLLSALASGRHGAYLDDPSVLAAPATRDDGNAILGHILGSKEVSRQVAANASRTTGVDEGVLKKMLPLVAAMAMGGLARRAPSAGTAPRAAAAGGLMSMLDPLIDRNRDGSMMDDVAGVVGGFLRSRRR